MQIVIYLALVAVCTFFVCATLEGMKKNFRFSFCSSPALELFVCIFIGAVLAGLLKFVLIYVAIPLGILLLILGFVKNIKK